MPLSAISIYCKALIQNLLQTDKLVLKPSQIFWPSWKKPGRDPRANFEAFSFDKDIRNISDLKVDMVLMGIVTNITAFGAFVDIGVHQDGLVHISEMADRFISDPNEVVKLNQKSKGEIVGC